VEKNNSDGSCDVEVSLVFNNEELRMFHLGWLDDAYRKYRRKKYGTLFDIETFRIHLSRERVWMISRAVAMEAWKKKKLVVIIIVMVSLVALIMMMTTIISLKGFKIRYNP
jgi:hypothetical protein